MKTDNIGVTGKVTTLATCWKLTRKDGAVMGFTDFSRPLTIDGVTYQAKTGYASTNFAASQGLNVDNLEVEGALSSEAITEADITAGKYNFATVQIFQVNYLNPAAGKKILVTGTLGEITRGDTSFKAEIQGLSRQAQRNIGQLYSETCRADLGDERCGVSLVTFTHTATVTAVNEETFTVNIEINKSAGYFENGLLTGLTGLNSGVRMEVKEHTKDGSNDVILTFLPMPFAVAVNDTFALIAGCNKKFAVCHGTFNNYLNFRGEPDIPGTDKIYSYPSHD